MTLLEKRIKAFGIAPSPYHPVFDRVVVWMLPEESAERDTFAKGGVIVKPETTKANQKRATARGVLVGAGLTAMDQLRGHGVDLGHIVWVVKLSPWRHVVDIVDGREVEFMFLRAGDIVGSEDLLTSKLKVVVGDDGRHVIEAEGGALPRFEAPEFNG